MGLSATNKLGNLGGNLRNKDLITWLQGGTGGLGLWPNDESLSSYQGFIGRMQSIFERNNVVGSCTPGQTLPNIESIADLHANVDLLECIFLTGCQHLNWTGGNHRGELISAINQPQLSQYVNTIYNGEWTFPFQCASSTPPTPGDEFIGFSNIAGLNASQGFWKIGKQPAQINLSAGQAPLPDCGEDCGFKYINMDYTLNPFDLCPLECREGYEHCDSTHNGKFDKNSLFPSNLLPSLPPSTSYLDIGTVVGKTPDNYYIVLAKAYGKNPDLEFNVNEGTMDNIWSNALFYAFLTSGPVADDWTCSWGQVPMNQTAINYDYNPLLAITVSGGLSFGRFSTIIAENIRNNLHKIYHRVERLKPQNLFPNSMNLTQLMTLTGSQLPHIMG